MAIFIKSFSARILAKAISGYMTPIYHNYFLVFPLVYHMRETGWIKVSQTDVTELHYKYAEEKKR